MIAELKLQDIVQNINFYLDFSKQPMSAKTAFKFSKILKQIIEEYNSYNNIRKELIERYAVKDDNGKVIYDDKQNASINNENYQIFSKEIEGLLNTNVQITYTPLLVGEISDKEFTPAQMIILEKFIEASNL